MFKEIKIFSQHGIQYIKDVTKVELTEKFRGRPLISSNITFKEENELVKLCPVNAIEKSPLTIDIGKCVFCNECHFLFPDKIKFTNDYKIASNSRQGLKVKVGDSNAIQIQPELVRKEIKSIFKGALKLRQVSAGGDNSAEMELNAAGNVNFDMGRWGIEFVASPRHADGIVITGPISSNMAEAIQITYDAMPSPKIIIMVGTDAISGGIFEGSKALDRSFIDKYPVDLYIPGNPPHPLTFINGICSLIGKFK
jgi:Ni,Fe-hydrogenase III small subunit/ferredoxin-like protein FixX